MAKITAFEQHPRERYSVHDEIGAVYFVFEKDGKRLFQLDTHGRDGRQLEGKTSQTIQLDQFAAEELINILKKAFML